MQINRLTIYTGERVITHGSIEIDNGKITYIGMKKEGTGLTFPPDYKCLPGMIDLHIHGCHGADVMDATPEALMTLAEALPAEGVTTFLATTITAPPGQLEKALFNIGSFRKGKQPGIAELAGVHLEGPFIHPKRAGAQPVQAICLPDIALFDHWMTCSDQSIKLVTVAPERQGGIAFVKHLKDLGVVPSIGHSECSGEKLHEAVSNGASQVTHLFNGMPPLHHRDPGLAGAALLNGTLFAELIVDGIHSHPEMVALAFRLKGASRIILITDAMRAKGLTNGIYELGENKVSVEDNRATLVDGTLAGSVLQMDQAVRNMLLFTDCTLEDIVQMTAINPARQAGIFDRKGSLEVGKDADLVILNEHHQVVMTICRGHIAFQKS